MALDASEQQYTPSGQRGDEFLDNPVQLAQDGVAQLGELAIVDGAPARYDSLEDGEPTYGGRPKEMLEHAMRYCNFDPYDTETTRYEAELGQLDYYTAYIFSTSDNSEVRSAFIMNLDRFAPGELNAKLVNDILDNYEKRQEEAESVNPEELYILKNFTGLDKETALRITKVLGSVAGDVLTENAPYFHGGVDVDVARALLIKGGVVPLITQREKFSGLTPQARADLFMETGWAKDYLQHRKEDAMLLSLAMANQAVTEQERQARLTAQRKEFPLPSAEVVANFEAILTEHVDDEIDSDILEGYFGVVKELPISQRPPTTVEALSLFGDAAGIRAVVTVQALLKGEHTTELQELGIHKVGRAGVEELRDLVVEVSARLGAVEVPVETLKQIEGSPLLLEILKEQTRFEQSEWGEHDNGELRHLLAYHIEAKEDGRLTDMPKEYVPSQVYEVGRLNEDRSIWTEDVVARYGVLRAELQSVAETLRPPGTIGGFQSIVGDLAGNIRGVVAAIDARLEDTDTPLAERGRVALMQRRGGLAALITPPDPDHPNHYPLRSLKDFENNFLTLAQHKELHPSLRKVVFAYAMRKHPRWVSEARRLAEEPNIDDAARILNFAEHVTNQETFDRYFSSKRAKDQFRNLTSERALSAVINLVQEKTKADTPQNTMPLRFVPTRGIMMELSGHIADACWASKYDSIAEEMPNMTAVIIERYPDTPNARFSGAGLLIETTDTNTNEPVLLVRGLNPLENLINHISAEQFYTSFMDHARQIASARGMKLAVALDDHTGGAASNREVLFNYMANNIDTSRPITVPDDDIRFNGYSQAGEIDSRTGELVRGFQIYAA